MKLSELYEGFETKLHRYAMRLVRDSHEAEDLVQKTFLRAMGHIVIAFAIESSSTQRLVTPDVKESVPRRTENTPARTVRC